MSEGRKDNIINFPGTPGSGIMQIRVELLLMPLPVWRRILVPGHYTFWDLHVAIQDAMGWKDRHLHQFTVDDRMSEERIRLGIPDDSGFYAVNEVLPCWEHRVIQFMKPGAMPVLYTYDFGDEWQHEVLLEATLPADNSQILPRCLAGQGICPPEDSGGPAACADLLNTDLSDEFVPDVVIFDDPRERWERAFRNE